jgi:hypothetical protein
LKSLYEDDGRLDKNDIERLNNWKIVLEMNTQEVR